MNRRKINIIAAKTTLITLICVIAIQAFGQVEQPNYDLFRTLPLLTFVFSIVVGVLNLFVINKLNKSEEKILGIVRAEFMREFDKLERNSATKEQVEFLRKEMNLTLSNIEQKILNFHKEYAKNA